MMRIMIASRSERGRRPCRGSARLTATVACAALMTSTNALGGPLGPVASLDAEPDALGTGEVGGHAERDGAATSIASRDWRLRPRQGRELTFRPTGSPCATRGMVRYPRLNRGFFSTIS